MPVHEKNEDEGDRATDPWRTPLVPSTATDAGSHHCRSGSNTHPLSEGHRRGFVPYEQNPPLPRFSLWCNGRPATD